MAKVKTEKTGVLSPRAAKVRKVAKTQKSPKVVAKVAKMSVKKNTKKVPPKPAPTHPKTSIMVEDAFATLKNRKGHTLAAIRNFIAATYKIDVNKNKRIQKNIKKCISDEFNAGRVRMVDSEEDEISYRNRFALVK
ncbi:histone H1, orphon-like [Contarinia nasturtii]|uniref:histone H1, orphon-like n=1 Tax=Contarinia nasturtii TaxID=265458 RepID=UPI0012D47FFB|nr:histone H1, orphon-like [Contarinia nasturtii]